VYNIGGGNEVMNIDLTHRILSALGKPATLIEPVADRPGHDRRYCLDTTKLRALGWTPRVPFERGLGDTIDWYRRNESWWRPIREQNEAFRSHYQAQYAGSGIEDPGSGPRRTPPGSRIPDPGSRE
jgi:dTDP-glucose 4,6-dehydratase